MATPPTTTTRTTPAEETADWGNALQNFNDHHTNEPIETWPASDFDAYLNLHS